MKVTSGFPSKSMIAGKQICARFGEWGVGGGGSCVCV